MSVARAAVLLLALRSRLEGLAASRLPVVLAVAGVLAAGGGALLLSAGMLFGAFALAFGLAATMLAYVLPGLPRLLRRGSVLLLERMLNRPSSLLARPLRLATRSLPSAPAGEVFRRSRAVGVLGAMIMSGLRSELDATVSASESGPVSSSAPVGGRAALESVLGADAALFRDDTELWGEFSLVLSQLSPSRSALVVALAPLRAGELQRSGAASEGRALLAGLLLLAGQVGSLSDDQVRLAQRLLAAGWGRTSDALMGTVRRLCG